jgi:hypothetical protein
MNYLGTIAAAAAFMAFAGSAHAPDVQQARQEPSTLPANAATSGDVNLTPRRIVFGPRDRGVKEITVFNRTDGTATYTITLTDQVMATDGALIAASDAPAAEKARLKSALPFIRYSPRQMTLGPHESQTVRLQARPPVGTAPTEYRTHFSVTAMPPSDTGIDIAAAAAGARNDLLEVRVTPVYGIMIPIFVRTGDLSAQVSISNVRLVEAQGRRAIGFAINRTGERSVYGAVDVYLEGAGSPKKIGGVHGLGVYGEIDQRRIVIPLDASAPVIGPGSRVKIVYTDDELNPGTILAQTEATLS